MSFLLNIDLIVDRLDQVSTSGVEPQGSTLWGSVPETQSIKSPNSHSQLAPGSQYLLLHF